MTATSQSSIEAMRASRAECTLSAAVPHVSPPLLYYALFRYLHFCRGSIPLEFDLAQVRARIAEASAAGSK